MIEFVSKVGTRGEIYVPKKYREQLGIKPNSQILIKILENGHIMISPIQTISDLLKSSRPRIKVDPKQVEKHSEEIQNKMMSEEN